MKAERRVLQEWEGYVVGIRRKYFTVNLVDVTAGETEATEQADLRIADIWKIDRPLLRLGAILRWRIGETVGKSGRRWTWSTIRFSHAKWTAKEMREADAEAKRLAEVLGWAFE